MKSQSPNSPSTRHVQQQRRPPSSPRSRTTCTAILPHGFYTIIPSILSLAGWILSVSQDGCNYAIVTGPITHQITGDPDVPYLEFGFNGYREPWRKDYIGKNGEDQLEWDEDYMSRCQDYDSTFVTKDTYWDLSQIFAFVSIVFGGGGALFLCFSSCFIFSPATWKWAGYEILLASFLRTSSFLWFATEVCQSNPANKCRLRYGSISDIVSASLWFVSAVMVLAWYPKPRRVGPGEERRQRARDSLPVKVLHSENEEEGEDYNTKLDQDSSASEIESSSSSDASACSGRKLELPLDEDVEEKLPSPSSHDEENPTGLKNFSIT